MKSQRGSITIDFLFSFILVMGFSAILFALTFTLSVVEITQYITYASARNYMASHLTKELQKDLANKKLNQLLSHPTPAPLFAGSWFEVNSPFIGLNEEYVEQPVDNYSFQGTHINLNAKMLDFHIPFFGSTASDQGQGFHTTIGSYLGRESSIRECIKLTQNRWVWIQSIHSDYSNGAYLRASDQSYGVVTDNGC